METKKIACVALLGTCLFCFAEDGYDNAYLEATDGQVINTRYFVKDSTRFEIDYRFVETNGQQQILFGNYYGCDNNRCVAYINGSGNFKSGLWSASASAAISANTTNL